MYLPARYSASDDATIREIVREHPFATLITPAESGLKISHVPLLVEERGGEWMLVGHLARANDHWRSLEAADSLAVFHGPQAYVTPLWYERCDVPTWNYVVAHLSGRARLLSGREPTEGALRALSARMEGESGWEFSVPEDLAPPGVLEKAIVAFEISVRSRVAKLKLSQNKSSTDFRGVMAGLATREDAQSRGVLAWMQRLAGMFSR